MQRNLKRAKRGSHPAKKPFYPSLAKSTPAQRRRRLLANGKAAPMTAEEWDRFLAEERRAWSSDSEIEEFTAWLRKARRAGNY